MPRSGQNPEGDSGRRPKLGREATIFEPTLSGCAARSGRAGRVRHGPQVACGLEWLEAICRPPIHLFSGAVQFAVMGTAERDREFVADLLCQAARLGKAKMMRI